MGKSLILLGYMGCGKSAVGNLLARHSSRAFVDLDVYIEQQEKTTIAKIFEKYGELSFRKKERFYLEQLLSQEQGAIIALGGGTPCYFDNMNYIHQFPSVETVYLTAHPKTLSRRLFGEKNHRPMIAHLRTEEQLEEFIAKHLFERAPFYRMSHHQFATDGISPQALAIQLEELLA